MLDQVLENLNRAIAGARTVSHTPGETGCEPSPGDSTGAGPTDPPASGEPEETGVEVVTRNGSVYVLEGVLGRGGIGVVYVARRQSDGFAVALKLPQPGAGALEIQTLQNEAGLLGRLNHPHIINVLDSGETVDGYPYIAMPIIPGRSLNQVIAQDGPLSGHRAASICAQVADAVGYAHDLGIVHRDIKPANIMVVDRSGRDYVFVLDFGISGFEDRSPRKSGRTTSGSLPYLAPEQLNHQPYTRQSDVYQLALVLYECLTGHLPFAKTIAEAVLYRMGGNVLGEYPDPRLSGLGWRRLALLERGLARDPDHRVADMDEFRRCLSEWLSECAGATFAWGTAAATGGSRQPLDRRPQSALDENNRGI